MHANGLMHCDIKSLNFLVSADYSVKLADLGAARLISQNISEANDLPMFVAFSFCGLV